MDWNRRDGTGRTDGRTRRRRRRRSDGTTREGRGTRGCAGGRARRRGEKEIKKGSGRDERRRPIASLHEPGSSSAPPPLLQRSILRFVGGIGARANGNAHVRPCADTTLLPFSLKAPPTRSRARVQCRYRRGVPSGPPARSLSIPLKPYDCGSRPFPLSHWFLSTNSSICPRICVCRSLS